MADCGNIETSWEKCILCQTDTEEQLRSPFNLKVINIDTAANEIYKSLAISIKQFSEADILPFKVHSSLIGESSRIGEILFNHKAVYHKTCRNKIDKQKFDRAMKRKVSPQSPKLSCETPSKMTRLSSGEAAAQVQSRCFFCNKSSGEMNGIVYLETDQKIRRCAHVLQDTILLAKLSSGDLIAQEAKYHLDCLTHFYYRASTVNREQIAENDRLTAHGVALGEVITYIEESFSKTETDSRPVHKLSDLATMYNDRVNSILGDKTCKINSTRLKERILVKVGTIEAHKQGKNILLVHKDSIGEMIKTATESNYDDDGIIISRAATILRRDILNSSTMQFEGKFSKDQVTDSLPKSLTSFVAMVLGGHNTIFNDNAEQSQKVVNVSEMIAFNVSESKNALSCKAKHLKKRETPLSVYLAMLIHAETRKKSIVEKIHSLGVCISYYRLLDISTSIGNYVTECFEEEGLVCPLNLKQNLFTTSAVDNIDHNPSSVTAKGSFHGTGISIFQHPDDENVGTERSHKSWTESNAGKYKIKELPEAYARVPPVSGKLKTDRPNVGVEEQMTSSSSIIDPIDSEKSWLDHVYNCLDDDVTEDSNLSWAAFHANILSSEAPLSRYHIGSSELLPLFNEQAKSPAMIRHSMGIVKQITNHLNPGQIPVMAADQPLFAIAKQVQWTWPNLYGENKFVVMFGGLHIELAALRTVGDLLEDSGWVSVLTQANVASSGSADSFIKASNIKKTRHAHQITAAALHMLLLEQYHKYVSSDFIGPEISFTMWVETCEKQSPTFMYWVIVLRLELTIMLFVRSLREGNIDLYVNCLQALMPWFFALDHGNYSRWLPIHIKDMLDLNHRAPAIAAEFKKGNFCLKKSMHSFSGIPLDQAHEQNNRVVKEEGGAVGLTENSAQLLRWMVCGPEVARLITEFEDVNIRSCSNSSHKHHEQSKSVQSGFQAQVKELKSVIEEYGNPFTESSKDLLVLDTRDIVDACVSDSVSSMMELGKRQYESFVKDRLVSQEKSIMDPIKQNRLPLFSRPVTKAVNKQKLEVRSLKENVALFSQLYIASQVRRCDLDEFFSYENADYPPSLSRFGEPYLGTKSELVPCLTELIDPMPNERPSVDAIVLDGAAIVNSVKPCKECKTFEDYAKLVFEPYILSFLTLTSCNRIDIVWDKYQDKSLKAHARSGRGNGIRRRVSPYTVIPTWESFLRNNDNKTELFDYLANCCSEISVEEGQIIVSTKGESVVTTSNDPLHELQTITPCNHEEADTRLFLHAAHIARTCNKLLIKTVDTDVVIIAISMFNSIEVEELWIEFCMGKHLKYIPIHSICNSLGNDVSSALLAFHAFSGCDQVSAFLNYGKRKAWNALQSFPAAIQAFKTLSNIPSDDAVTYCIHDLERFVVLMYDRTSACDTTNEARRELFTTKVRALDNIPPTSAALLQHTRRAVYQAGYVWAQCLSPSPCLPSPAQYGWKEVPLPSPHWEPLWSTLFPASKSCSELLKCGCNPDKGCRGRCKCIKANMPCTTMCRCKGLCDRS